MRAPLCHLSIHFSPEGDVVVPPFTSKVSKTILIQILGDDSLLLGMRDPGGILRKPLIVSPVLNGGRPLFRIAGQNRIMRLRAGTRYAFRASAVGDPAVQRVLGALIDNLPVEQDLKLFNTRVSILDVDVVLRDLPDLGLPDAGAYRISFKTPTILQFPRPWRWRFDRARYCLLPHPHLIIWSLARHWNSLAPPPLRLDAWRLSCYAGYALVEVDYDIRPVTAIYEGSSGPRGFMGWILFEHRKGNARLDGKLRALLDYANYVGVGKSRSIGFGMVEVRPV